MTLALSDLLLYAGSLCVLFLTPGPVWVALIARSLASGFSGAWPLALGVVVGDVLWPLVAIFGLTWLISLYGDVLELMRWIACIMFVTMGVLLVKNAAKTIASDNRLTRPGMWAGFLAGLAVIIGNPKAVLFYMGMLPGFFDLSAITTADIIAICSLSFIVPLIGNLALGLFIGRARSILTSPTALRRTNIAAGVLLVGVGLIIPLT